MDTSPKYLLPSCSTEASKGGTQGQTSFKSKLSNDSMIKDQRKTPCLSVATAQNYNNTFVPCVVVAVRNPSSGVTKFLVALLDSGCTGLVLSNRAAEHLGVKTWSEVVTIKVLEESTCSRRKNCLIDLFSLDNSMTQYLNRRAVIVDSIPIEGDAIPRQADVKRFDYMHDVKIIAPAHYIVDLIISVDMADSWCHPIEFRRGLPSDPIAFRSG